MSRLYGEILKKNHMIFLKLGGGGGLGGQDGCERRIEVFSENQKKMWGGGVGGGGGGGSGEGSGWM